MGLYPPGSGPTIQKGMKNRKMRSIPDPDRRELGPSWLSLTFCGVKVNLADRGHLNAAHSKE